MNTEQTTAGMDMLGVGAQNTAKTERHHSFSKLAGHNSELVNVNPNCSMPPPTDHGVVVPI